MTHNFSLLITFITILFLSSCKKQDGDSLLGLDIQPENDLLGITVTDSASLFMHTTKVEPVRSYSEQYKFLGSTQDPIFGKNESAIYTNFSIQNNLTNVSFGSNPVLDSTEMVIRFVGQFVGDTNSLLNYHVQLLNSKLSKDSLYRSNSTITKALSDLNSGGKIKVVGNAFYLVLPLDNAYAQSILQNTSNLTNNTAFQNVNKGFYISATNPSSGSGSGSIRRFDLYDDLSGVKLYYHDGNSSSAKPKTVLFTFRGPDALNFNALTHDYTLSTTNLKDQIITNDTTKGKTNIYLNSFGGTRVRVYLPFIKQFADSQHVSINRAELIIKVDESNLNTYYSAPENLTLLACGSAGQELATLDQQESSDFEKYNGKYDATKKQYVFNIARHVQQLLLNKQTNYGFYLVNATPSPATAIRRDNRWNRVMLGGTNNTTYKPYFKITYIKYPYDK